MEGILPFRKNLLKGEFTLEKLAVVNLSSDNAKLQFVKLTRNKSFVIYDEVKMPINLTKDFYSDYIIKPTIIKEVLQVMQAFKNMIDAQDVSEILCFATNFLNEAKNSNGFIDQIENISGFKFNIVEPEQEINGIYNAVVNSFNKPKGLIANISNYNISFISYNRRNVLDRFVINFGYENLYNKYVLEEGKTGEDLYLAIKNDLEPLIKEKEFITNIADDFEVIGAGNMFINLASIAIKAKKYPINIVHNYPVTKPDFEKVYGALKGQDVTKATKVKGVSLEDSKYLLVAFQIMKVLYDCINKDVISISKTGFVEGVLFNHVIPLTMEKPISDTLGYSLSVIDDYYNTGSDSRSKVHDLSMLLFKQLKVLHKLGRSYVRVVRIASSMYNSGMRVTGINKEHASFDIVLNSDLYGVTHAEIILAGFVTLLTDADNFNLSDWVKYRELITDEDLVNVKRIAILLRIAQSLDITGFSNIEDINCDILGDSVIMKTAIVEDAGLEIRHAMLASNDFKKAFGKTLEIL